MQRERTTEETDLIGWERLPAFALGISQGLNIFLWYVMSLERVALRDGTAPITVPGFVVSILPFAVFVAAVAAAVSLDGTMIAAVVGSRHGREGAWTWITIAAAALFSAGIALDVYGGNILPGAWLHIAQTAVLLCYMMHLRQRKKGEKTLQGENGRATDGGRRLGSQETAIVLSQSKSQDVVRTTVRSYPCKVCGEQFSTLSSVSMHARRMHHQKSKSSSAYVDLPQAGGE